MLWVCNTIGRVMNTADQLVDLNPLIYHSRFKYEDRVKRHKAVVDAFTPEHKGRALAVCSQVAEMSLDLKGCTLLITDRATVPALIQRLGRLNRQADKGSKTRPFVVIEPRHPSAIHSGRPGGREGLVRQATGRRHHSARPGSGMGAEGSRPADPR